MIGKVQKKIVIAGSKKKTTFPESDESKQQAEYNQQWKVLQPETEAILLAKPTASIFIYGNNS